MVKLFSLELGQHQPQHDHHSTATESQKNNDPLNQLLPYLNEIMAAQGCITDSCLDDKKLKKVNAILEPLGINLSQALFLLLEQRALEMTNEYPTRFRLTDSSQDFH